MPNCTSQTINAKEGLAEEPGGEQRTGHSRWREKPQLREGRNDGAHAPRSLMEHTPLSPRYNHKYTHGMAQPPMVQEMKTLHHIRAPVSAVGFWSPPK